MKNRIAILLAALCLCAALFTGCADKTATPEKEAVLNSYEKYDDLLSVRAIDNTMHGSIELSDDPDYVTDGEKSAKFTFNRDYGNYSDTAVGLYSEAESFSFVSSFLPEKFRFIDRYEYVSLDVYSAAEQVMTLYLNVIDADGNCLDGNFTRLASKGWTHVRFDLKPWFYEKGTTFGELRFYVRGWQDITADKVVMYFDNMRVGFTDNTLPERNKPADVSRNGIELLRFDDCDDSGWVTSVCEKTWAVTPFVGVTYDPAAKAGSGEGALRVTVDSFYAGAEYDKWSKLEYARLQVHPEIAKQASGADSISVMCYNASDAEQTVSLRVLGASSDETVSKVAIAAGKTAKIEIADRTALVNVQKISLCVDVWRVCNETTVYFSDLVYTVHGGEQ